MNEKREEGAMGEAKRTEIKCAGCGKKIPVTTGEGHTGVAKCDCGATTYVQGEPGQILEQLNELLVKAPALLQQFKDSRRKGFETGLDQAIHDASHELAMEILREDPDIRGALRDLVRASLEEGISGGDRPKPHE